MHRMQQHVGAEPRVLPRALSGTGCPRTVVARPVATAARMLYTFWRPTSGELICSVPTGVRTSTCARVGLLSYLILQVRKSCLWVPTVLGGSHEMFQVHVDLSSIVSAAKLPINIGQVRLSTECMHGQAYPACFGPLKHASARPAPASPPC